MAASGFTVECADHGEMTRDVPRKSWECPEPGCGASLPDSEVYRLVTGAPAGPDPVPIVVT